MTTSTDGDSRQGLSLDDRVSIATSATGETARRAAIIFNQGMDADAFVARSALSSRVGSNV